MEDTALFGKKLIESLAATEATPESSNVPLRKSGKPRSMTVLKLQWLAERARKCMAIKEAIEQGTYKVSSEKVAKAILNYDEVEEEKA